MIGIYPKVMTEKDSDKLRKKVTKRRSNHRHNASLALILKTLLFIVAFASYWGISFLLYYYFLQ